MADLSALIKLHKYELDEKRMVLAKFYEAQAGLEAQRLRIEREFQAEKDAIAASGDVHFTFAGYAIDVKRQLEELDKKNQVLEGHIEEAKESMMETFGELKKYELTQEERARLEDAEQKLREGKELDEIGLESFRRKEL